MKFLLILASFGILMLSVSCDSTREANSNTSVANATLSNSRIQNVDVNNLPPGLSASPLAPPANMAPGIPNAANAVNSQPRGTTPTPGIPDPSTMGKPAKPGLTPTPGIPDPATLKKQMEEIRKRLNSNSNQPQPPPPGAGDGQMMRKQRKITNVNSQ
jgi:hypothetical protein